MIEINSNKFEFAHGRKPSGIGYWAFIFDGEGDPWFAEIDNVIGCFKYPVAKRAARAEAKRRGASKIEVGS